MSKSKDSPQIRKIRTTPTNPLEAGSPDLTKSANTFPVVGIGASAGGLDAFKKLLKAIPENSGMAYVLVQHLHPGHESMLSEILQKVTKIPVLEITDDIKVKPDHIYIIPSNKMLIANDGVLQLTPRTANKNELNLPIDLFFTSLAEVHQSHSIGVVLSGTASDGTNGLKAIKEQGGITFAQDPESAAYNGMPESAIQAGVVDFILSPEKIPKKLLEITKITNGNSGADKDVPQQDDEHFKQMLALLRVRKGTDFTYYKQTTIRRRILRRMALNKSEDAAIYLKFLRESKHEQDILYQDLLIPVTSFFRDPKSFENLCETVFPEIIKNENEADPIRIWVAGCSTGQEVYSMAICLREFLGNRNARVQLFATDISEPAILKARSGIYSESEMAGLSSYNLQEFFIKNNDTYQVNKSIRDLCVFAVHNFLRDPPFGKMNLISCRNVLIYMEPYLQKKALTTFHYALNNNGFLMLGKSETISSVPELFGIAHKGDKLFSRKDVPGKYMHTATMRSEQSLANSNVNKSNPDNSGRTDFQKTADDILLSKYTPAGVVVNEAMDIVHFRGKTVNYLEQLSGKPSHNLLKMAKEGLAFELRNILHKSKKEKKSVKKENIPLNINGNLQTISIEALLLPGTIEPHYLVLFHENHQSTVNNQQLIKNKNVPAHNSFLTAQNRIAQLEKELAQAREDMRSITEDQEAVNEELQSANEELLSGSEELQSLNEELETGKEELQSTNEELSVVNQEMIGLNQQVTDARDYAEAIITTIREPLLVLDRNLRVKSANNAFYKTFHVNKLETEGRLVYHLGDNQWNIPVLRTLLENILPEKALFADFEVTHNFQHIGVRVMQLNGREIRRENDEEKLILLAIEDVTEKTTARKKVEESETRFRTLMKDLPMAVYSCDAQGFINYYNNAAVKAWGREPEIGKDQWCGSWKLSKPDGTPLPLDSCAMTTAINEGRAVSGEEVIIERPDGTNSTVRVYPQPIFGLYGEITGGVNVLFDVTEQNLAIKKMEESENRYHNMIYSSPSLISIFKGEDMIIEVANDAILESWGKGKDIIGKPLLSVMPEIIDQGIDKLLLSVYKTGEPVYAYETPVTLVRNGKVELMHYTFVYQAQHNFDGEIEGLAIIANEVTPQVEAKKLANAQFSQLAELTPEKISSTDAEGNVIYFNQNWLEYTGLSADELKGTGWQKIIHPDDRNESTKHWKHILSTGNDIETQLRLLDKNEVYKWHLRRTSTVKDNKGKIVKWITATIEIQQLKEEEQRKGDFVTMLSHELKTPVTSIKGYIQLLLKMVEKEREIQFPVLLKTSLSRIDKLSLKLTSLISDMLDLTRIEANRLELKNEIVNLNDLTIGIVEDFQQCNQNYAINLHQDFRCSVKADKDKLGQVLINFISNAIKYSPASYKIDITISKAKKNQVSVSVTDYGIGINKKEHKKIFERFYRIEGKTEQNFSGFGIGLFIAHSIIERHGGFISVDSEEGKGSVFTFTLPVVPAKKNSS